MAKKKSNKTKWLIAYQNYTPYANEEVRVSTTIIECEGYPTQKDLPFIFNTTSFSDQKTLVSISQYPEEG